MANKEEMSEKEFCLQKLERIIGKEEDQDPAMRNILKGWKKWKKRKRKRRRGRKLETGLKCWRK